jgi:serine/threonine-protein kinase
MQQQRRVLALNTETQPEIARDSDGALDLAPPSSSRYRLGRLLGRGGMGEVHACEDEAIGRNIAIKTMKPDVGDATDSFLREARLQARLEHPAIVPVYEIGTTKSGAPFFTMKQVRGITLENVLDDVRRDRAAWSLRKLLTAFANVCLAVDYAHSRKRTRSSARSGSWPPSR